MRTRLFAFALLGLCVSVPAAADLFLVSTSEGPGFGDQDQAEEVLGSAILPTFERLLELKAKKKIVAGGLPVGSRTFRLIVEADSHDEVDRMLRDLPAWGLLSWKVTPLQSLEGRAEIERRALATLKSGG